MNAVSDFVNANGTVGDLPPPHDPDAPAWWPDGATRCHNCDGKGNLDVPPPVKVAPQCSQGHRCQECAEANLKVDSYPGFTACAHCGGKGFVL